MNLFPAFGGMLNVVDKFISHNVVLINLYNIGMYDFILQIILVSSLGVVIYLMARALPRVPETESSGGSPFGYVERLMQRLPLAKIDAAVSGFFERLLRKTRVLILKTENLVNSGIHKLRSGSEKKQPPTDSASDLFEKK